MIEFLLFWATQALAEHHFRSPFPSTVVGLTIPNAHRLSPHLLRGMAPSSAVEVRQLTKAGVTQVLMFRKDEQGEPDSGHELQLLKASSIRSIHHIPFPWKDITSFKEPCRQTVQALKIIGAVIASQKETLYFHCTRGEDRTGYLAALYRVIFEDKNADEAFRTEMCAHGYAESNPNKPQKVVGLIQRNIGPLYLKMTALARQGLITKSNLNESVCDLSATQLQDLDAKVQGQNMKLSCPVLKLAQ